jgi:hypothetical protein
VSAASATGLAAAAGRLVGSLVFLWLLWSVSRSKVWRVFLLMVFLLVVASVTVITVLAPYRTTQSSGTAIRR